MLVPSALISFAVHIHFMLFFIIFSPSFYIYSFSSHLRFSEVNVELIFNASLILLAPSALISFAVHIHFMSLFIPFSSSFLLLSFLLLSRFSEINAELIFNASLILLAPSALISLSVHIHFVSLFIVFSSSFLQYSFSSQLRFSEANVELIFNASLITLVPESKKIVPCSYSIPVIVHSILLFFSSIFILFHFPDSVISMNNLSSMPHLSCLL